MTPVCVWLDITELVANPLQTGIQRMEREIVRHWPMRQRLAPCRYDSTTDRFVRLPEQVFDVLGARGEQSLLSTPEQLARLQPLIANPVPVRFGTGDILLNPEVFFEPSRARHYRLLAATKTVEIVWIVFDFVVYLRPQDYLQGSVRGCMHYLQAMRDIGRVVFISEKTRTDHARIVRRDVDAIVVPLGADGLGLKRRTGDHARNSYVCMGTIEPRKNIALLLEVFSRYWQRGGTAALVLAGRFDSRATREAELLAALADEPRLCVLGPVNDATMREVLSAARATFYLSEFEGFGIPPIESLYAGVPVVVHRDTPSVADLPVQGQIRLDRVTPETVAASLEQLEDDEEALRLWGEASTLSLPTWRLVVELMVAWITVRSGAPSTSWHTSTPASP